MRLVTGLANTPPYARPHGPDADNVTPERAAAGVVENTSALNEALLDRDVCFGGGNDSFAVTGSATLAAFATGALLSTSSVHASANDEMVRMGDTFRTVGGPKCYARGVELC